MFRITREKDESDDEGVRGVSEAMFVPEEVDASGTQSKQTPSQRQSKSCVDFACLYEYMAAQKTYRSAIKRLF